MNKYQEALERIINHVNLTVLIKDYPSLPAILRDNQGYQDLDLMKELVDKETPMKPVLIFGTECCVKCKQCLEVNHVKFTRCNNSECGQVVDWTDEDE